MKRISSNMGNTDMQYHLRLREWQMNSQQNKMAEQTRIGELRDDPVAAAHSTRYLSRMERLARFSKNAETLQSDNRIAEGYMRSAGDILQRVRELAIQGATGTYTREENRYMAEEVNQLLNEMVVIANGQNGDGRTIFGGDRTLSQAFRVQEGHYPGVENKLITGVKYVGTIDTGKIEINEGNYLESRFPGNQVFWAEDQQIFADREALNYQVDQDSSIRIDGVEIDLKQGDNIHTIMAKINGSGAAVEASLDPVNNSLMLKTTVPHQIWLENGANGQVLTDLGLIDNYNRPPDNYADGVAVAGGSMFDMMIQLRDNLYDGDKIDIGGAALKGLDLALNNLLSELGKLGAQDERLSLVQGRLAYEIPEIMQKNLDITGLDMAKAITDLKMLEFNHKAALQTSARILQPTLLDFLR